MLISYLLLCYLKSFVCYGLLDSVCHQGLSHITLNPHKPTQKPFVEGSLLKPTMGVLWQTRLRTDKKSVGSSFCAVKDPPPINNQQTLTRDLPTAANRLSNSTVTVYIKSTIGVRASACTQNSARFLPHFLVFRYLYLLQFLTVFREFQMLLRLPSGRR